jgi:predicted nucleotidyltransferase
MPIDKVYLYGSYVKGLQHNNSDVDICFFSKAFEARRSLDVLTELFYLKIKYDKDLLIEPNAFPFSELDNDNPFVKEILSTGREII